MAARTGRRHALVGAWTALVSALALRVAAGIAKCPESFARCSWPIQGYIGPLDTAGQLKAALEATSFRKEVIVTAESRVDAAAQFAMRYRRAGWSHVLVIMERLGACQQLAALMAPYTHLHGPISCGYYRTMDPNTNQYYPAWFKYFKYENGRPERWRKWFTTGRAIALGYNVLAVDSDTVVMDDWYARVKAPPLAGVHMLSQAEGDMTINGGFTYVQNAAPNGPVAWIIYEAVQRAVRWSENCTLLRKLSSSIVAKDEGQRSDDQTMITEAMLSALAGRPVHYAMIHKMPHDHRDWTKLFPGGMKEYDDYHWNVAGSKLQDLTYGVELPSLEHVCDLWPCAEPPPRNGSAVNCRLRTGVLRMPHFGGEWPMHMGGRLLAEAGPYTRSYREAYAELREFGAPRLLDPEDPADEAAAAAMPTETFMLLSAYDRLACPHCTPWRRSILGAWLEGAWWSTGRWGHWHAHLFPRFKPAIGHVHVGTPEGMYDTKNMILKLTGHWDWKLAARAAGAAEHSFYATAGDREERREPEPLGRVVAYAPGVVHMALSKDQYVQAVEELARIAVAVGAVAAWPPAPCDSDWVLNDWARNMTRPIKHTIPWTYLNTTDVVQPHGDTLDSLQCEWMGFINKGCLASPLPPADTGRGLLAVEFRNLLTWIDPSYRTPSPANTLRLAADGPLASPPPPGGIEFTTVPYGNILSLNAERLLQAPTVSTIVWVDRLVAVGGGGPEAEAKYQRWKERCRPLSYRGSNLPNTVKW